jgi:lipopolysaccharide transport system ATP-binding protein
LILTDAVDVTVRPYLDSLEQQTDGDLSRITARRGQGRTRLRAVTIRSEGQITTTLSTGSMVRFDFLTTGSLPRLSCVWAIYDQFGQPIASFDSCRQGRDDQSDPGAPMTLTCQIDEFLIMPGRYRINAAIYSAGVLQDHVEGAVFIDVVPGTVRGRPTWDNGGFGRVMLPHRWITPGGREASDEGHE